ncbi:MAG: hypothetical protein ACOX8W_04305 [bacterium]
MATGGFVGLDAPRIRQSGRLLPMGDTGTVFRQDSGPGGHGNPPLPRKTRNGGVTVPYNRAGQQVGWAFARFSAQTVT